GYALSRVQQATRSEDPQSNDRFRAPAIAEAFTGVLLGVWHDAGPKGTKLARYDFANVSAGRRRRVGM
ncbi:MAG TPA: hypothetical protein VGP38_01925, partial [Rubrobacter sp.]|nr:hypothetical protein [Rubrobacter sp.]